MGAIFVRWGMVRIEADRLGGVGNGAVEIAQIAKHDGAFGIGRNELGIERNRPIEIGGGAVVIAFAAPRHAAIGEVKRGLRIDADRLIVIRDGTIVIADVRPDDAAGIQRVGLFRIEPYRVGAVRDRAFRIPLSTPQPAANRIGLSKSRALRPAGCDQSAAGFDRLIAVRDVASWPVGRRGRRSGQARGGNRESYEHDETRHGNTSSNVTTAARNSLSSSVMNRLFLPPPSLTTWPSPAAEITNVLVGATIGASPAAALRKRRSNGFRRE